MESLLEFKAEVEILSQDKIEQINELIVENNIKYTEKSYEKSDLRGFDIIIAATNDNLVNQEIKKDAKDLGILINIVDDPQNSDFIFGASVKKENIMVSIGTSGMSPVLARMLKKQINLSLLKNLDGFNEFILKNKDQVREKLSNLQARRMFWQEAIEGAIGAEIAAGNIKKAQKLFDDKFSNTINENHGAVYFIGAGPGDPELITVKAINLLSKADIVLYDRLVGEDILDYARRDAIKINVGKKRDFHRYKQNEINDLIAKFAKEGNIVARLKGGDATIFAHLSEEIACGQRMLIFLIKLYLELLLQAQLGLCLEYL